MTYRYQVITQSNEDLDEFKLNQAGKEGWKLVSAVPTVGVEVDDRGYRTIDNMISFILIKEEPDTNDWKITAKG